MAQFALPRKWKIVEDGFIGSASKSDSYGMCILENHYVCRVSWVEGFGDCRTVVHYFAATHIGTQQVNLK